MEPEDTTGWYQPPSNPHTRPDGSEQFYVSKSDYDAMVAGLRLKIAGLTQERNNAKRCLLEQNEVTTMLLANLRNRDETIAAQKNMLDTYYSCYGPIPETVTGSGEQTTMPSAVRHANTGNSHPASRPHAASSGASASVGTVQQTQGLGGTTMSPQQWREWEELYGQSSRGNPATSHNPGHPGR
ncbi:uncharacterized protein L203_106135 [Cryptococcus depauperatus CBS 7841]|uniref:Uncharacterized protein n=1 Tax=Cryptococcus depauperatus CBS 7841 TaxID=1295531 RepID=A0AAJ8JYS3_9TREE